MNIFDPFYDPADMTACVAASTTIAELNAMAAKDGIYFPLWRDPMESVASLYLNTRFCSRSFRFGSVGDNTLGCRFQLGSGKTVDLGGRVVKNVVGFDLTRFFAGSQGKLGQPTTLVLRLRPLPAVKKEISLSGSFSDLEGFRAQLMKSAWVHCIDAFDFELDGKGLRLGIAYACTPEEAEIFERSLSKLAGACSSEIAPLPMHSQRPTATRLIPLSQILIQAQKLQGQYGGRVSGYLGNGLLLFEPETSLPSQDREDTGDLEDEIKRHLEALA